MNRSQLVEKLASKVNLSHKEAKLACDTVIKVISESIADNKRVEIRGFGSFHRTQRVSFLGLNPKTGEKIVIPEKFSVVFRSSKDLKNKLNN